jgi:DNA mismatch repair protein MutL
MTIKVLDQLLANQIAAGEVVERPASVVKELMENSFDADCKTIWVTILQGGHELIRVRDDGKGIPHDELGLALERHATSKISELADLIQVSSLGFRGEALASIAAVSRIKLMSKSIQEELGWCISQQGLISDITPISHPQGTTIEVCDLFYNTPARRKFLRQPKTELCKSKMWYND